MLNVECSMLDVQGVSMSSEVVYYDTVQKRFVYNTTGHELAIKDYPSITFKEQKVITWNIGRWDSDTRTFTNIDLTQFSIHAWQSSVDVDFKRATEPMIRVLNANIDSTRAKDGIIVVTYNADTKEFEKAVDGQVDGQRKIYIELKGYDSVGKLVFFSRPRLSQVYGEMQLDPGTDPTGETTTNYYTTSEGDGRYAAQFEIPANIESKNNKNQASGYAGLDENSKLDGTQQLYGTTGNTACEGNDSRLADSRIPIAHALSHITDQDDAIQCATAIQDGLMTSTQVSKLDEIEDNADVTDSENIGSSIHNASIKNTPIDNDEFALVDFDESNVLKKTFWSTIKSTLKSYFDAFYFGTSDTPAQGDILYHNGSEYKLLPPGTDGQFLKTQGAGANPAWATPTSTLLAPDPNSTYTAPTDEVWLNTSNGYGSTNTAVRRFNNIIKNNGSAITYTDSPKNGASFTINTTGIYAISYSDCMNTANNIVVSLNSTLAASNVSLANRLTMATTSASGYVVNCSCIIHLTATDVLRCVTDAATNSGSESKVQVIITRLY